MKELILFVAWTAGLLIAIAAIARIFLAERRNPVTSVTHGTLLLWCFIATIPFVNFVLVAALMDLYSKHFARGFSKWLSQPVYRKEEVSNEMETPVT